MSSLQYYARSVWKRIVGWANNSEPGLLTKGAAEFTGCMLFHFLGSAMPTPATNAIALTVLVYYTAKLSGAHLNPALTTTFALLGYTNPVEVFVYWIAQVSGCIVGALWLAVLVPGLNVGGANWSTTSRSTTAAHLSGCFVPSPDIDGLAVLGWEAICTFCFILPIFSVVWYTQSKSGYGNTGPLIVGLSLYSAASVAAPWTGAALNPARAIASRIVFGCDPVRNYTGFYVAGELIGAAVVPIAIAPWYGMSWTVMQQIHKRAYSYSITAPNFPADRNPDNADKSPGGDSPSSEEALGSPARSPRAPYRNLEIVDGNDSSSETKRSSGADRCSTNVISISTHISPQLQQLQQQNDVETSRPQSADPPSRQRRASNTTFALAPDIDAAFASSIPPYAGCDGGAMFPPENKYVCAPIALIVKKRGLRNSRPCASPRISIDNGDSLRRNLNAAVALALSPTRMSSIPADNQNQNHHIIEVEGAAGRSGGTSSDNSARAVDFVVPRPLGFCSAV